MTRLTPLGTAVSVAAAVGLACSGPAASQAWTQVRSDDFPTAALAALTLLHAGLSAWALLVIVLGALPGCGAVARRLAPRACVAALVVTVSGTTLAQADTGALDGLRLPDRTVVSTASASSDAPGEVTVQPGDSLWSLASRHLPDEAMPSMVAEAVEQWYQLNRPVIGHDPDMIQPGQRLLVPARDLS